MIDQLNIYGMTKLEVSIERIKQIEPRGGVLGGLPFLEGRIPASSKHFATWQA